MFDFYSHDILPPTWSPVNPKPSKSNSLQTAKPSTLTALSGPNNESLQALPGSHEQSSTLAALAVPSAPTARGLQVIPSFRLSLTV